MTTHGVIKAPSMLFCEGGKEEGRIVEVSLTPQFPWTGPTMLSSYFIKLVKDLISGSIHQRKAFKRQ